MSATKILWGQIVIVFAIVLATMWAATQWVAWKLGYQPQLGHPWFELISGVPIYLPPSFFWWWYAYDAYAPNVFVEGAYIASSGGFISIAVAVAMSVWRAREAKTAATYGSARWATLTEIRAAGLTAPDGVVLGRFERDYLRHDGPEHVLMGPTGAGKSVLLALMALQFRRYPEAQVFAFDFGGSIRAAALAMGGDWHDLGGALSDDATEPVALQPLARIDDAAERAWAAEWIANILARETIVVTPEAKDHLWSALTSLASAPVGERTLTGLSVLLQSQTLKRALQPYCLGGPYGRLLDAEAERLGEAEVQAFETEGLIGTSAAPAVLA
jgi:hypothetical protein